MDQTTSAEEETEKSQAQQSYSISCPSNRFKEPCINPLPQTVTAAVENRTNSITLTVKDCDVVIVGQPVGVPCSGQSCALLNYRDPSADDEAISESYNRIPEFEGTSLTKHEIVFKDKPEIPQKHNVCVESDTSIMIKTSGFRCRSSTSNDYETGISERQAMRGDHRKTGKHAGQWEIQRT